MQEWTIRKNTIQADKIIRYQILENKEVLSFKQVIQYWMENSSFRKFYNDLLLDAKFENFFWEHPPLQANTLEQLYEFVLVKSTSLAHVIPLSRAFKDYYQKDKKVVVFPNLGKNALMVVPVPKDDYDYAHLGRFIRNAPEIQLDEFWKKVGAAFHDELGEEPKWLSTHGLGVYWLHIRIDQIPKYYHYQRYKNW